jgi:hypothetical protein
MGKEDRYRGGRRRRRRRRRRRKRRKSRVRINMEVSRN